MKYSDEFLLKYNIKSIAMVSEPSFAFARIIITSVDAIEHIYDIKTSEVTESSMDSVIKKHIIKKLRKEKLIMLNNL